MKIESVVPSHDTPTLKVLAILVSDVPSITIASSYHVTVAELSLSFNQGLVSDVISIFAPGATVPVPMP